MCWRLLIVGPCNHQVKCTECQFESCRSDPFLDISLEINRASSVARALQRFTAAEYLEGDNKYKCPKQRKAVRAAKRMAIEVRLSDCASLRGFGYALQSTPDFHMTCAAMCSFSLSWPELF